MSCAEWTGVPLAALLQEAGIGSGAKWLLAEGADAGVTWAQAQLGEPVQSRCLTRFRIPWHWEGAPFVLQSRAYDDVGNVQPARADWSQQYTAGQLYHCNGIIERDAVLDAQTLPKVAMPNRDGFVSA